MDLANLLSIFLMLGLVFFSTMYRLSAIIWTSLFGVMLIVVTFSGWMAYPLLMLCWMIYFLVAAFANLHQLRRRYIITPLLQYFKKQLPTISDTERAAIEAGDTWWEKELFCGQPNWQRLFAMPKPSLSPEEQSFIEQQTETVCRMIDDWKFTHEECDLTPEVWDYLKKEKFFGMIIPKQYGGLGFSAYAHSTVVTKIASRSISAAVSIMVPNSLGPAELLTRYGTDEQKNHYLPKLATGAEIPCFALTAPEAGSDAGSIPDTGIICHGDYQGKNILGIRLSWDKRYITLAPIATVLGIAFKLYDPEHLLGEQHELGITLCLIPTSHPGVEIGHRHYPMSLAFMNGPTRGKDVFIPLDWVIGGPAMVGQGWRMLMECLSIGRSISLPALSTGASKITYRLTGAYARIRRQFNTSIANFEGVGEALGYIAGYTYMINALRMMTAGAIDQDINPAIVSAIAKYHMTEMCRHVVSHAMDVHAGHMIQVGPRNFLANIYAALPISITVEGANILTRNLIIFGQGAIRCHPYILQEIELISAATPDVAQLDTTLMAHIGYFIKNLFSSLYYGVTNGQFIRCHYKNRRIRCLQRQLTRMSSALALLADTSLILLGGNLKRRERISARLGDILSQLYIASAVLKYHHDHHEPSADVDYVCWSLQQVLAQIQQACDELCHNFSPRWVGTLLHWLIFPWGKAYCKPTDKLHHKLSEPMLSPCELRDRVTQYAFVDQTPGVLAQRLELALKQIANIEPIWKKLHKALDNKIVAVHAELASRLTAAKAAGILTDSEIHELTEFDKLQKEIIQVNEFSFELDRVII